jgi:Na+/melibiose symporter-like transporter
LCFYQKGALKAFSTKSKSRASRLMKEKGGTYIMAKNKVKDPNHLGFGRLMAWKSSDISAAWINVLMLNFLSIYASDTLGIDIGLVATLLLASKIVDGFTDLFAGWIVDNTHTKLGKGRPYELAIIGMTVCTILLFAGNPAWSDVVKCVWIFFMYTMTFSIFSTMRAAAGSPYTIRHFSNNPILIRKVASYGGIVTMAGSIIINAIFPVLVQYVATSASGWTRAVAIVMIPATAIGILRFLLCKEDPSVDATSKQEPVRINEIFLMLRRNKYVWFYAIIMLCYNIITNLAVGTYYFKWIIGSTAMMSILSVSSIILLPLMLMFPWVMKKMGSMGKMIGTFSIIGIAGYAIVFVSNANVIGVLAGNLLGNFAVLPLAYYGTLFIMQICTYNEMLGMQRMDGSSAILSNFASKLGGSLGA